MPFFESDPYSVEIASHVIDEIIIRIHENTHTLHIHSFDAEGVLVKEDTVTLPVFDITGKVIMPPDWSESYPTGEQLYAYMEKAYYQRLQESTPWLIGQGTIQ